MYPGTKRTSSAAVGKTSPTPISPGSTLCSQGTQGFAKIAFSPGSKRISLTVTSLESSATASVTDQCQPKYALSTHLNLWVRVFSPSTSNPKYSPTRCSVMSSIKKLRATSLALFNFVSIAFAIISFLT